MLCGTVVAQMSWEADARGLPISENTRLLTQVYGSILDGICIWYERVHCFVKGQKLELNLLSNFFLFPDFFLRFLRI